MSLKKQTVWSTLPLITITVVNLVSVPLFYRYLGPEMYALWFYVLTFTGAFGFMDLGLGLAVGRYVGVALGKNDREAVLEYWGTGNAIAIPLLIVMGGVFALIGIFFGPKWFNVTPSFVNLLRWSFVAGGASLFLSYYAQFWLILSQAHLDFKFISITRTAIGLLQVIPSIALAWATRNPFILILWSTAGSAAQLAVFVWHARKSYRLGLDFGHASWARATEMAVYTGKTFATLLVGALLGSADRLLVGRLASPIDFARYSISSNAGSRIVNMSIAAMGPVLSNTSRAVGSGSREAVASVYNEMFDFTFPWYALASVWVSIWHPAILRLWLGEELGASVEPLLIPIIIGCCLTAIGNMSWAQLSSLNRVGVGLIFQILTCVLLVGAVSVGWRWAGVVGVAWGFLFSRVVSIVQDLFLLRLVKAGGWLSAKTWKHLGIQIAIGLAFASTMLLWPRSSLWQLIPAGLHGTVVATWLLLHPLRATYAKYRRPYSQTVY